MFYKTGLLSRGLTIERGLTFQYLRYSIKIFLIPGLIGQDEDHEDAVAVAMIQNNDMEGSNNEENSKDGN